MVYEKLYHILLDGAEKAIAAIEAQNYGLARELLIQAEQRAEEVYLERGEGEKE